MYRRLLLALIAMIPVSCGGSLDSDNTLPTGDVGNPAPAIEKTRSSEPLAQTSTGRLMLAQTDTNTISGRFELGKHYQRLSPTQPTSSSPDQIEVAEIFWYGCSHCYTFDPFLESWRSDLPNYVRFIRVPAVWNPLLQIHARAFYTAEVLGKSEEMHTSFFREIHVNGNFLDSEAALASFFGQFGVSQEEFQNAYDSFAIHAKLQRAAELSRRYRVSSVPMVVVNGKYTTSASEAGGYPTLIELIDELVAIETSEN